MGHLVIRGILLKCFGEISAELFYLDHLLRNLSCLVNIQDNFGISHYRIKCPAFTKAGKDSKIQGLHQCQ